MNYTTDTSVDYSSTVELTHGALAQAMGATYMDELGNLADLDNAKLVDVGKDVLDLNNRVEAFTNGLLARIAKIEIDARKYITDLPSIFVETVDLGWFVERVKINLAQVIDDPTYHLEDGKSYADLEHTFFRPSIKVKIFDEVKEDMIPFSTQRKTLQEAFTSWSALDSYVTQIRMAVRNTLTATAKALAHNMVSSAIAISNKATNTAVHLLTEAKNNGIVEDTMTAEEAINNEKFLVYALSRIKKVREYIKDLSTAYNNGSYVAFTSEDMSKLALLTDFDVNARFNAKAYAYNADNFGIGDYDTVNAWQAIKAEDNTQPYNFTTASSIKIAADESNKLGLGIEAVECNYCIGLLYDRMALGIYSQEAWTTTSYTASASFWTDYYHRRNNRVIDTDYNIVAFMVD